MCLFSVVTLLILSQILYCSGDNTLFQQTNPYKFNSTSLPPFPTIVHPFKPVSRWGTFKAPYPTNEWWQNLMLADGADPIFPYPYSVKALAKGVAISMPPLQTQDNYVAYWFSDGLCLTASGIGPDGVLGSYKLVGYDDLSATIQYTASKGTLEIPFFRGSPYITGIYSGLTPGLTTKCGIKTVNSSPTYGSVTGTTFELALYNNQTWLLFSSKSATFTWNNHTFWAAKTGNSQRNNDWVIRVAAFPPKNLTPHSTALSILSKYSSVYPIGGNVDLSVNTGGSKSSITFSFKTKSFSSTSDSSLLLLTLPHHRDVMPSLPLLALTYTHIVGKLVATEGNSWNYNEDLSHLPSWQAFSSIASEKKTDITAQLKVDMQFTGLGADPYTFGKSVARLARLVLIADALSLTNEASTIRNVLKKGFTSWLDGTNDDPLRYDTTWGGISPLKGINDKNVDFGAGYYSDHHFHYGYWLYAAAVVGKGDAAWAKSTKSKFMALCADIASPSSGTVFPKMRYFDWYVGHSWAAGLFNFADGRNQESISECINGWYGMYLYGMVVNEPHIMLTGKALLASELRTGHKYWHMDTKDTVYPEAFSKNKCIGMLWGDKCDLNTWFGAGPVYAHAINMIPFTPITELLLTKEWMKEEYPVVEKAMKGGYSDDWKVRIYMGHAVIEPTSAWNEIKGIKKFDDGDSRTNAMWWVATRPK